MDQNDQRINKCITVHQIVQNNPHRCIIYISLLVTYFTQTISFTLILYKRTFPTNTIPYYRSVNIPIYINLTFQTTMQEQVDKVQYTPYDSLPTPSMPQIADSALTLGFDSKQWTIQFQTVTTLRQANKHYETTFLHELLPKFYQHIIAQVDNLRSNNSKEALTLLTEVFTHQDLNKVEATVIKPIIHTLFLKSVCEKGFLKNQALKAISKVHSISNPHVTEQLMNLTKSNNGTISELAIKTLNQMLQHNKQTQVSQKFLKDLSYNINGKRSVVQKQAKEILGGLKKRVGEEKLEKIIENSQQLDPEESNTLKRQLKRTQSVAAKPGGSFREFMKLKKNESNSSA